MPELIKSTNSTIKRISFSIKIYKCQLAAFKLNCLLIYIP